MSEHRVESTTRRGAQAKGKRRARSAYRSPKAREVRAERTGEVREKE